MWSIALCIHHESCFPKVISKFIDTIRLVRMHAFTITEASINWWYNSSIDTWCILREHRIDCSDACCLADNTHTNTYAQNDIGYGRNGNHQVWYDVSCISCALYIGCFNKYLSNFVVFYSVMHFITYTLVLMNAKHRIIFERIFPAKYRLTINSLDINCLWWHFIKEIMLFLL